MIRISPIHLKQKRVLEDIFSEKDDFGLLQVEPLKIKSASGSLAFYQFEEIIAFYESNGRIPNSDSQSMEEIRLARRLDAFKCNPNQNAVLSNIDIYGWLSCSNLSIKESTSKSSISAPALDKSEVVKSLNDIFADDDGLLEFDSPDIFLMKHVPIEKKTQPDEIAKRQPCSDFPRFAPMFEKVQNGFKQGEFSLIRFTHVLNMQEGDFFTLYGVMGYVYKAGERLEGYSSYNARLHLVFENGTESNMLFQSLTHGLVRDKEGRKVLLNGQRLMPNEMPLPTGIVYVLATQSTEPALVPYKANLYKVGFTEGSIGERIEYAEKDKTFLEAPVRVVMTTECYNISAQKLEALVHGFLAGQRLNISLRGHDGQIYSPREWFNAPLATIQAVIKYILEGTISQYRMDNTTGKIVSK